MTTYTTLMTGLRGIGRINEDHRNPSVLGFVRHKLLQLVKAPTLVAVALWLPYTGPLADTRQIFQGNLPLGGLCRLNDPLTDAVVNRAHMALLSAGEPLQKPDGFFRAFALERTPHFGIVGTQVVDLRGVIGRTIGINSDTPSAKINSQCTSGGVGSGDSMFDLDMQEERAITAFDQRGTGQGLALESRLQVVAQRSRKPLSPVEQGQAEGPIPLPKAEDTLIVVNRGGLKRGVGFALDLQGGADTSNRTNGQISRQPKAAPHLSVAGMLDIDLVTRMDGAGDVSNKVAGVGKRLERRIEFGTLLRSRSKFASNRSYAVHKKQNITYEPHIQRSAQAAESVSSSASKEARLPRAKAQFL